MATRSKKSPTDLASVKGRLHTRIAKAPSLFIALDYDGTLVPIAERPELAKPTEETVKILQTLSTTSGVCLAVVSGRNLEILRGFLPIPNLVLAGLHGLEVWPLVDRPASRIDVHVVRAGLDRLIEAVKEKVEGGQLPRIEDKRHGVSFHFRGENPPVATKMRSLVTAAFREIEEGSGLILVAGKQVLEARPEGVDKGTSTLAIQDQLAPGSLPIIVGDDITDEDLFDAYAKKGITVRVGGGTKKTSARYALKKPADLVAWLGEIEAVWRERGGG